MDQPIKGYVTGEGMSGRANRLMLELALSDILGAELILRGEGDVLTEDDGTVSYTVTTRSGWKIKVNLAVPRGAYGS